MKNLSSLICKRYLSFKKKDSAISFMVKMCFLGITIGSFSLMLTLIVMNGFEKQIHQKMQGINAQILIYSPGNRLDGQNIKNFLLQNFGNQISGISSNITRHAILDGKNDQTIIFIKGIDASNEHKVTNLHKKITLPLLKDKEKLLPELLKENGIIIGTKMAKQHDLKLGDQVTLLIPKEGGKKKINLKKKTAKITAFFKIGLEEYDNNFAFASMTFLKELFKEKEGVDNICIKLKSEKNFLKKLKNKVRSFLFGQTQEKIIIKNIQNKLPGLTVTSWKNLYPALVSSLKLEKYVMFFILALIILVASMSLISLLSMQIQQKRKDIAIFKAMGMNNKIIKNVFLKLGMKITFWASVIGLGLAAIAGFLLEKYPFIELPDVYYISHLPATMETEIFVVVFLATMIMGLFAVWIPVKRTKRINVTQVLRQE